MNPMIVASTPVCPCPPCPNYTNTWLICMAAAWVFIYIVYFPASLIWEVCTAPVGAKAKAKAPLSPTARKHVIAAVCFYIIMLFVFGFLIQAAITEFKAQDAIAARQ